MPLHLEGIEAPLDPGVNLDLGASYLARLERRYGGDLSLALAAYHAGPGAVKRWGGLPADGATRRYVERVLTRYQEHRQTLLQDADVRVAAAVQRGS
jgi:soluble lytic murein transglycosylase-like protein